MRTHDAREKKAKWEKVGPGNVRAKGLKFLVCAKSIKLFNRNFQVEQKIKKMTKKLQKSALKEENEYEG